MWKLVRFWLWDLWVKIILWVCLFFIMIPFKVVQYGVRFATGSQRKAQEELLAVERERLALEKQRLERETGSNRAE